MAALTLCYGYGHIMHDVCYDARYSATWADVKRAMSRIKKFRKDGFYLEVKENTPAMDTSKTRYTIKVFGPPRFKAEKTSTVKRQPKMKSAAQQNK